MTARILVAGIGNIFLGDDGFGSEVVRHAAIPPDDSIVRVIDYGIRGMHLAYDLLDAWDTLVLVDAVPSRGSPGTLHVFEADHESPSSTTGLDAHSMDPAAVFASLRALGGLSEPVAQAVPRAVRAVEEIVAALQAPGYSPSPLASTHQEG